MTQKLREDTELDTVEVGLAGEELTDGSKPGGSHGGFPLTVQLVVDVQNFGDDICMILGKLAKLCQVLKSLLVAADLNEPTRRLFGEE